MIDSKLLEVLLQRTSAIIRYIHGNPPSLEDDIEIIKNKKLQARIPLQLIIDTYVDHIEFYAPLEDIKRILKNPQGDSHKLAEIIAGKLSILGNPTECYHRIDLKKDFCCAHVR